MNEQFETRKTEYRWPDLSPVTRQYIVKDDQDRMGIAYSDSIYHDGVLFAHPIDVQAEISHGRAILMTDTTWMLQPDGSYSGTWYDYGGPIFPATVPPEMLRCITVVQDLGYLMPDKWADHLLSGLESNQPPKTEMNVNQAEDYAREVGESVTARAIRLAADHGYIPGARKIGRDWLIPYDGFNHYLDNRPKRGRK